MRVIAKKSAVLLTLTLSPLKPRKTCIGLSPGINCVDVKHVMEFGMISIYTLVLINKIADLDKERITPLATKICKKKRN